MHTEIGSGTLAQGESRNKRLTVSQVYFLFDLYLFNIMMDVEMK